MKNAICIEHGDTTCAVEPGKFCLFFGTKSFGTKAVCTLFRDEPLFQDENGWTERCPDCMDLFKGETLVTKEDFK